MKKIFCELCDGTEFKKENGMFVCLSCGTSYSVEEARGMMREVEGNAPASAGTPVVATPVEEPNQTQIDNLLVLATNAYESNNFEESENYCNKVIELDVTCYKAWMLKGQAIGWQSTYGKPRVSEGANAMRKAVDYAPEEEKEDVSKQAINSICSICTALCSLAQENYGNNPTKDNRDKFKEFSNLCAKGVDLFNDVSKDINEIAYNSFIEYHKRTGAQMNLAGVAAVSNVRKKWKELDHPNTNSWETYLEWYSEIVIMFKYSILNGERYEEKEEEIIIRYKNLIIAYEDPIDSCSWKQEWVSYANEYRWFKDYSLSASAIATRKNNIQECNDKIDELQKRIREKEEAEERKAAEEKQARIDAYWAEHTEEKAALENEREVMNKKIADLATQIREIDSQINAGSPNGEVPSEAETRKLKDQIRELENRRAKLGMFAGKEKKQIGEEIAALYGRIESLRPKIDEEKRARQAEYNNRIAPLTKKRSELQAEQEKARKRVSAIYTELTKDPEV